MPLHPSTNFDMQKYYQNEPRFNRFYIRDNWPYKIKNESYVINLDEHSDIGTHWISSYALNHSVTYFDSFGVETFNFCKNCKKNSQTPHKLKRKSIIKLLY